MKADQQELLIHTGPETPCGKLLRAYWQPIALSEELPQDGGAPIAVKILGEELVLFRDAKGTPALLGRRCPHRAVDLCYGRIEEQGLRCIYHGWLFDSAGTLLEQPGVPQSSLSGRLKHKAYPCHEAGGMIFTYMGEGTPPIFPAYEFLNTKDDERYVAKIFHDCNYFQAVEGTIDQVHLSFLHRLDPSKAKELKDLADRVAPGSSSSPMALLNRDVAPHIEVQNTSFGMREVVTREAPEGTYVKVENFVFPGFAAVPGPTHADRGYLVNWHVPIDDRTHWKFMVVYRQGGLDKDKVHKGLIADVPFADYRFQKSGERYPQDRAAMRNGAAFAGLGMAFAYHDVVVCEAQGQILDRTNEILGPEDKSIALVRRIMLDAIKDVEEGRDPPHLVRDPAKNVFPDLVVLAEVIPDTKDPVEHVADRVASRAPRSRETALV